jgi:hypothetical protein
MRLLFRYRMLRHRIGRRGVFLLALALMDLANAARMLWPPPDALVSPINQFLAFLAPLPVWGVLWGAVGLLCAVQAFMVSDRAAFAAASALKVGWAILHAGAWVAGVENAWWSVAVWLTFAGVVHVIATWPEVPPMIHVEDGDA